MDTDLKPLGPGLKFLFHSSKLCDPWARASLVTCREGERKAPGSECWRAGPEMPGSLGLLPPQQCPAKCTGASSTSILGNLVSTAHPRPLWAYRTRNSGVGQQSVAPRPPCDLTARSTLRHTALSISLKIPQVGCMACPSFAPKDETGPTSKTHLHQHKETPAFAQAARIQQAALFLTLCMLKKNLLSPKLRTRSQRYAALTSVLQGVSMPTLRPLDKHCLY